MLGGIGGIISGIGGMIAARQAAKEREAIRKMIEQYGKEGIATGFRGLDAQYDSLELLLQNALDQELFSRAGRVDPYGNRLFYDKDTNTWEYDLSPMQQQLFRASQDEQLRQLTADSGMARAMREHLYRQNRDIQDANRLALQENERNRSWNTMINNFMRTMMRSAQGQQAENDRRARLNENIDNSIKETLADNRQIQGFNRDIRGLNRGQIDATREIFADNRDVLARNRLVRTQNDRLRRRLGEVGDMAMPELARAQTEYRFGGPPSEGAIRDDITRLIAQSMGSGDRLVRDYHNQQMARKGGSQAIVTGGSAGLPEETIGPQIAQTMLQARGQAIGEAASRRAEHENKYATILQRLVGQLGLGAGTPESMGGPAPMMGYQGTNQAPISQVGRGPVQTNTFGNLGQSPMLQPTALPGGQDATGAVASNLNALETNMANAIANAMGTEANALNSGYGRIGQSYQNMTNNYGNIIRGIASTMPSGGGGGGGGGGKGGGGMGGLLSGIGGLFGGG